MTPLAVRALEPRWREAWLAVPVDLWPDADPEELAGAVDGFLAAPSDALAAVLVAVDGARVGFLELALRPCADGCTGSPVAHVEAWWVKPSQRRRGVGRTLIDAAEA